MENVNDCIEFKKEKCIFENNTSSYSIIFANETH